MLNLLVALSIAKLYTHDITFSDICNFLVKRIIIFKIFSFFFFLSSEKSICVLPLLSDYYCYLWNGFFLWNSQGDYAVYSYINWWKLLIFTWKNNSMKNVSTKVNRFTLRFPYLGKFTLKTRTISRLSVQVDCLPYFCFFSKFPHQY